METNGAEKKEVKISDLDTKYLIYHVGAPLTKALTEIVQKQPLDPIEYLSCWLYKYKENQLELKREKERLKIMMEAEIEKMKKKACIEEEKRLVREKRKEMLEQKRKEKLQQEEEARKKHELEEARNQNLQSPEKKDENGQTTLHRMAAELDADFTHLDKMPMLLADRDIEFLTPRDVAQQMGYEANVTEIDKYVLTLLKKGEIPVLKYLLLNSYEYFQPALDLKQESDNFPDTSMMFLATINDVQEKIANIFSLIQDGDEEAAERLLEIQPQLASSKNNRGHTLLHVAILFDNISVVKQILETNPEAINTPDNVNRTPLHYAYAISETISEILLENKAMDSVLDIMHKTPADYKADPSEIIKLNEYYTSTMPPNETEIFISEPMDPLQSITEEANDEESNNTLTTSVNQEES